MRWLVPPDEPAAAKPRGRGLVDDCHVEERGEDYSDLPYNYYDYFGSEYHDYDTYVYYYYKVFEGIIKADAQRSDIGRFHSTHGQQVHWLGE